MKRRDFLMMAGALVAGMSPAMAQLVSVVKHYRVHKVDIPMNRIEVRYLRSDDATLFVLVDGYTQVFNHHRLPMSWTKLRKGDLIKVKGGLRVDGKIRAKTIFLTHA